MNSRALAALFLGAAIGIAAIAALRLSDLRSLPERATPFFVAFLASLLVAAVAGRLAPEGARREDGTAPPPSSRSRGWVIRLLWVDAAALLLVWAAILLKRPQPPLTVFLVWGGALVCAVLAFPHPRRTPGERLFEGGEKAGLKVALLLVLVLAGCARLIGLERVPAVFSGDEASQTLDGRGLLDGSNRTNPFGTGWYSSSRLGMLPAGAGSLLSESTIAGPRMPYAVAGTLSVVAASFAAGGIAGWWAALGAAALLAFAPHHVHFSRLASIMILDALFASATLALLLAARRFASPRLAAAAGVSAGLALYGYSGGRAIALAFLLVVPGLCLSAPRPVRWLFLAALLAGFAVSAAPNVHFAFERFGDWGGRFQESSIFAPWFWNSEVPKIGAAGVVARQFRLGTLGLLSMPDTTVWFTGYPIIGPPLLIGLGIAGFGWMIGRRLFLAAAFLGLLVGANFAAVVLTTGAPAPQRPASLVSALAILGGAAIAGFLTLLPGRDRRGVPWRPLVGALAVGAYIGRTAAGFPLDPERHGSYGGHHSAFAQSVGAHVPGLPRDGETVYFHGRPWLMAGFEWVRYHLAGLPVVDVVPPADGSDPPMPPGLHVFPIEEIPRAALLRAKLGIRHGLLLPYPGDPRRDSGYVFRVVESGAATDGRP